MTNSTIKTNVSAIPSAANYLGILNEPVMKYPYAQKHDSGNDSFTQKYAPGASSYAQKYDQSSSLYSQ